MGYTTSRTHLAIGLAVLLLGGTLLAQGLQLGELPRLRLGNEKPVPAVQEAPAPAPQPLPGRTLTPAPQRNRLLVPLAPRPRREATPQRRPLLPQLGRLLQALAPEAAGPGAEQAQSAAQTAVEASGDVAKINPTRLEVRLHGGDFEKWVTARSVCSPQSLTFRWRTTLSEAVSGFWVISQAPFGPDPSSPFITSGFLGPAPDAGKDAWVHINFAGIMPETPPSQPVTYYVRLYLCGPGFIYLEPPSNTVQITYVAPAPPTQFPD